MRPFRYFLIIFILVTAVPVSNLRADIIEVPDDQETIQRGINAAGAGDTVLVYPGEYEENIDFGGRNIVVGSLYLTTGDEAYIDSTIIDGGGGGPVVHFHRGESPDARLTGFTIQGGTGYASGNSTFGGGIHNWVQSNATLDHLIIRYCRADNGGGIYCQDTNNQRISHVTVYDCNGANGAGIRVLRGSADFDHVSVHHCTATSVGGGFQIIWAATARLTNVTISENEAQRGKGIYISAVQDENTDSYADLVNTIVWGNGNNNIYFYGSYETCRMSFSYCDIEGGIDDIVTNNNGEIDWGDGNIDEDPSFVDPGEDDFHLTEDSPCINTGDPESPEDPDGSRADMGALPFFAQEATLDGYVYDLENNNPLQDAIVMTSLGQEAVTDEDGYWLIDNAWTGRFNLTASKPGYNDSTRTGLQLHVDETLSVNFSLCHPVFFADPESLSCTLDQGNFDILDLMVQNNGNGTLEWSVEPQLAGEGGNNLWELRRSIDVGFMAEDDQIRGVVFADDHFYVSGTGDETPLIYVLNRDGDIVNSFEQVGDSQLGMRDLAWDGELIWGSGGRTIYGFNTEGAAVRDFEGPFYPNTAITWDPENEVFWICSTISDYISGVDRWGDEETGLSRHNLNVFGLACYPEDPEGYTLYVFNSPGGGRQVVSKINPTTDEIMEVAELEPEGGGRPEGAFISNSYDPLSWVFIDIANPGENDRIDIWQLSERSSWLEVEPLAGEILPGEDEQFMVLLDATHLVPDTYEGELNFSVNTIDETVLIPVLLEVLGSSVGDGYHLVIPDDYYLSEANPNPFNPVTRLTFGLPSPANVSIKIYDVTGRIAGSLAEGEYPAGTHMVTMKAERLVTGVYFIRMESTGFSMVRKVMLIR